MEIISDIGRFFRNLVHVISDPPMMTAVTIAKQKGWLGELASLAVIGAWRLARGLLDIIMGTMDMARYFLMAST